MAAPQPASEAVELFNRLTDMNLNDCDEAVGLAARLRRLNELRPGDAVTMTAYGYALLLSGQRDKASDVICGAFELAQVERNFPCLVNLSNRLVDISDLNRAVAAARILMAHIDTRASQIAVGNTCLAGLWSADLSLIDDLRMSFNATHPIYFEFWDSLPDHDLYHTRQTRVINSFSDCQVGCQVVLTHDSTLLLNMFIDRAKCDRDAAYDRLYSIVGEGGDPLSTMVRYLISEAPSPQGRLRLVG